MKMNIEKDYFALQLIIEPNKQNLHENITFEYLKTIDFIKNPKQLEKSRNK